MVQNAYSAMRKNKKGFTLVELTIVLALTAVVVTMVFGFVIAYNQQSVRIVKSSETISDVNQLKDTVFQWIDENDNGKTAFTVSDNRIQFGSNSIVFDSGKLTVNGGTPMNLRSISTCRFYKKPSVNNVIYCDITARIGKHDKAVQLMFDVHYGTSRERS